MKPFNRMRLMHWLIAGLFLLAWLTSEAEGPLHEWVGYALAGVLLLRLVFGLARLRGFGRLWPEWGALRQLAPAAISRALAFALILGVIGSSVTGWLLQSGDSVGISPMAMWSAPAHADRHGNHEHDDDEQRERSDHQGEYSGSEWLEEVHEAVAQGTLLLVLVHVGFLFSVRRPMLLAMLGRPAQGTGEPGRPATDR